jgi:non-ribosomal peptide synthetase component F
VDVPQQEGQFELSVKVLQRGDAYRFILTYDTDLYDPATVERLAGHYRILLRAALDAPGTRIAAVSLVDHAELARMLAGAGAVGP